MKTTTRWYVAFIGAILGAALFTILIIEDITFREKTVSNITVLTWLIALVAAAHLMQLIYSAIFNKSNESGQSMVEREKSRSKKIEIIVVCIAAVAGLYALNIYKETNLIAMRTALEERDSATRAIYFGADGQAGGERLMSVFFNDPDTETANYADCDAATQQHIREWAKQTVTSITSPEHAHEIPQWSNVRELYESLFDTSTRASAGMNDVRRAFFHVIDYVYIVHDAHQARIKKVFNDEEYEMWASYLEDIGPSPYFFLTMIDGHGYGYMTRAFSEEIWSRFSKNRRLNCFAQTLYADLAKDKKAWMDTRGTLRNTGVNKPKAAVEQTAAQPAVLADGPRPAGSARR